MEKNIDLQTFEDDNLRARRRGSISEAKGAQDFDRDRYELARVGKEQVLKVRDGSGWQQLHG
jgi:choline transport protein